MIKADVVGHSKNEFGNEIQTQVVTFPRIILAEFNTHRMFSRNSASSRAIPFKKALKSVMEKPFIPIAFQKDHSGMQGTEYFSPDEVFGVGDDLWHVLINTFKYKDGELVDEEMIQLIQFVLKEYRGKFYTLREWWLICKDSAVKSACLMAILGVTKQLANRLLEPFMYHTVIVTATEWENFFALRCPQYVVHDTEFLGGTGKDFTYRSKDFAVIDFPSLDGMEEFIWLRDFNKGQAEIHMMALAEAMWDAYTESVPKQLKAGEWHIPFGDKVDEKLVETTALKLWGVHIDEPAEIFEKTRLAIATARCARISYTVVGEEYNKKDIKVGDKVQHIVGEKWEEVKSIKHDYHIHREAKDIYCEINGMFWQYSDIIGIQKKDNYENDIKLHDKLAASGHMSPFEHCAQAMSTEEMDLNIRGKLSTIDHSKNPMAGHFDVGIEQYAGENIKGWSGNFRGFIQYRKLIPNENITK